MGSKFTQIQVPPIRRSCRPGDTLMTWLLSYGHYNKASFVRGICHLPELPHCSIQLTCQQVAHVICRLKTPANLPTETGQDHLTVDVY